MFADKDISLFYNPLYDYPDGFKSTNPLDVQINVSDLHLWSQCYFRFLPLLEIIDGGKPRVSLYFLLCILPSVSKIHYNDKQFEHLKHHE